jgi:hypothetical protein
MMPSTKVYPNKVLKGMKRKVSTMVMSMGMNVEMRRVIGARRIMKQRKERKKGQRWQVVTQLVVEQAELVVFLLLYLVAGKFAPVQYLQATCTISSVQAGPK